jgi:UDPglucose 6-dehydrogenase
MVTLTDPAAIENARQRHPQLTYDVDLDSTLRDADAVVVVTEWDEYRRELSPEHAASLARGRIVIDGRNCLDPVAWRAAGWTYHGMGRP